MKDANRRKDATAPSYENSHEDQGDWTFFDASGTLLGAEVADDPARDD